MTLRENFEEWIRKRFGDVWMVTARYDNGRYALHEVQALWESCQFGHAEGISEAARRCAEIAGEAIDAEIAQWRITKEYPEAFK